MNVAMVAVIWLVIFVLVIDSILQARRLRQLDEKLSNVTRSAQGQIDALWAQLNRKGEP